MRSVSEDKEAAALMGIDVDRTIASTFALGGIAAGLAGILYLLLFPQAHFFMGFIPSIKAFTAAVLALACSAVICRDRWRNAISSVWTRAAAQRLAIGLVIWADTDAKATAATIATVVATRRSRPG